MASGCRRRVSPVDGVAGGRIPPSGYRAGIVATGADERSATRFAGLDGLRALAVALVVWHNYRNVPQGGPTTMQAGYIGVVLFFVISGFLITSLMWREVDGFGGVRVSAFYLRRVYRLYPAMLTTLAFLVVVSAFRHRSALDIGLGVVTVLAYVFNFALAFWHFATVLGADGWPHLWSLSVEEQFYLVWPVALGAWLWLRRRRDRDRGALALATVLVLLAIVVELWRTWLWWHGASESRLYLSTDTRLDALLIGAAFALLLRIAPGIIGRCARASWLLLPMLFVFVVLADVGSRASDSPAPGWMFGPGMGLVAVLSLAIVALSISAAPSTTAQRLLSAKPVVWIGQRSYAIYLFHLPLAVVLGEHASTQLVALIMTLLLAELSHRLLEEPVRRRLPAWARRSTQRLNARSSP